MSKKKKATAPKAAPTPKVAKKAPTEEGLIPFYFKAILIGAVLFGGIYYMLDGYIDMNKVNKVARRIQKKDKKLTGTDYELYENGLEYSRTKNFQWFHNYKWVYHTFVTQNNANMIKMDSATLDDKQMAKSGVDFNYLKMIRDKTPEDAIIIMPSKYKAKRPENAPANTPKFKNVYRKSVSTYFLYPRTLIYENWDAPLNQEGEPNETADPDYEAKRAKATHVAILYGHGYDELKYPVTQREYYTILPIEKEAQTAQ